MKKKIIFAIIILIIISSFVFLKNSTKAIDKYDDKLIDVDIPDNSTSKNIAKTLYEKGLIKNELIFNFIAKKETSKDGFKAGEYEFSKNMNLKEIIQILKDGPNKKTLTFTIPEGYELRQISEKLSKEEFIDQDIFEELASDKSNFEDEFEFLDELDEGQSLEGYLFPATYEINRGEKEEDIIRRMLTAFELIYNNKLLDKIEETNYSLNEVVTLASIIEREGKLDEERPLMSAVFHNRMKKNMNLGSCATVQYVLGERKEVLSNQDIKIDSPYNTYINSGLPPAPIAAPGESSLIAAVEPADVDYLYFVLTGEDGSHTFTNNYKDHLKAKNE